MLLSRKALLTRDELKVEKVILDEEKDEFVFVREMTGHERDNFETSLMKEVRTGQGRDYESSLEDYRAKLAVNTMCDEKGVLLLSPTDYLNLSKAMSAGKLQKIVTVAQSLNKMKKEDQDALVKNSSGDQVASSSSDSAEN